MSRRFTVMGFTEAELGFALAAFFVAVGAGFLQQKVEVEQREQLAQIENDSLRALIDSLEARLAMRSRLTPPCSEKGESSEPVARLLIRDGDRYEIDGDLVEFTEVRDRLGGPIARSKRLGCRYTVEVVATTGVEAPLFSRATGRLRTLFYVRER
jgi:hypothetical protein